MTEETLYRNKHMRDVDFFVTKVLDDIVKGYWVNRWNQKVISWDELHHWDNGDWEKVGEDGRVVST